MRALSSHVALLTLFGEAEPGFEWSVISEAMEERLIKMIPANKDARLFGNENLGARAMV
jgi:hypothetical protein